MAAFRPRVSSGNATKLTGGERGTRTLCLANASRLLCGYLTVLESSSCLCVEQYIRHDTVLDKFRLIIISLYAVGRD